LFDGADRPGSLNLSVVAEVVADLTEELCYKSMVDKGEVPLFLNLDTRCRVNFVPVAHFMRDLIGHGADVDGSEKRTILESNHESSIIQTFYASHHTVLTVDLFLCYWIMLLQLWWLQDVE
jgi:hypothetical protein